MPEPIRPIDADAARALTRLAVAGELAAGVAHETRNLVTAILGFAQLGRRRHDAADPARYLGLIEREALRSLDVLDRFLGIAAPASTTIGRFDVAAVLDRVASTFAPQLDRTTITVEIEPRDAALIGLGRSGELEQVLVNLVLNAIHAMPDGGRIQLTADRRGEMIAIAVTDDGPGVPVELRQRIFEAFFTTRSGQGTGLGLALCARMLGEVGGTIELEDRAGGARFVVQLPAGAAT